MVTLSEFLQGEMRAKHLSQSELARRIGVYPDYIKRWIDGDIPQPKMCAQIAEGVGVPVSMVMQMSGYPVGDAPRSDLSAVKAAALATAERLIREAKDENLPHIMPVVDQVFTAANSLSASTPKDVPGVSSKGKPSKDPNGGTSDPPGRKVADYWGSNPRDGRSLIPVGAH